MTTTLISERLPRYTDYNPMVPVWCVTPTTPRTIHRFFDSSPFSPSGRFLVSTQLPVEGRLPIPGDVAQIVVTDLQTGDERVVADSRGWDTQLGTQAQWGATDQQLLFNDLDMTSWEPFGVRLNPGNGSRERLSGTIYAVSPNGQFAASSCLRRTVLIQPGYGVIVPRAYIPEHAQLPDDDGVFITDLMTGRTRLLISIRRLVRCVEASSDVPTDDRTRWFSFHVKWNSQGDRVLIVLRSTRQLQGTAAIVAQTRRLALRAVAKGARIVGLRRLVRAVKATSTVRNQVIVLNSDGTNPRVVVPAETWAKGGNHPNWCPDGKSIIMNLNVNGSLRFVRFNATNGQMAVLSRSSLGSGHPTLHPNGRYILTDAYPVEPVAFGDGTVPIRLVDWKADNEKVLVRITTRPPFPGPRAELRVDAHPAWDRNFRRIAFNACPDGTRRVYIAELDQVLDQHI